MVEKKINFENLHVSEATIADAADIEALVNRSYRGEVSKLGWTTEADFIGGQRIDQAQLTNFIEKTGSKILLAKLEGMLLGCVHIQKKTDHCDLGMLAIDPKNQGNGLGKHFLKKTEFWIQKNWHCRAIQMHVISRRTELISWYERRGYIKTGDKIPFPYNQPNIGLPKESGLEFLVLSKSL